MMLFSAFDGASAANWAAAAVFVGPLCSLILYGLFDCVRNWQRHLLTRMIVREAPVGTVVESVARRGNAVSTLVVEVGDGPRRLPEPTAPREIRAR
ncbi:hypothetical protein [Nocardia sp. CS682]|uniref:hypothetical protein n=1 Tax=Nocardia sp. CS682 TaxID=1047172 RepID=UPI001074D56B|nr:hypothetical protein [Nocardia sp. CS682]QBS43642.1 hypothetical protein DMB37_29595 [Nocardia sp. CS682]